ncbi:aldo/keto reductase [Oceanobacillus timonensis]|uniref:aldo/keto reductase n=1 Tax=Oceanobacillus timonensis TaxID=1926285 RepID=UPI0009BB4B2A|nr:aldo/keto reductase [Oceanobacillus timonensis]
MVQLGNKSLFPIGMGTWHMGDSPAKRKQEIEALRYGLENGIEVIDTAEMYGEGNSEQLVGEAIQDVNREDIYLISKFYPFHAQQPELEKALEDSLNRLGTEYLDLYLLHWKSSTPLAETIEALEKFVKEGRIRAWGVSNFDVKDVEGMWEVKGGENSTANQVLYNIASRGIEYDLLPLQRNRGLPTIAYSPAAQGDTRGDKITSNKVLQEIARAHNATVFQVMLAWTIRHDDVLAIPQSSDPKHIQENIDAARINFSEEELQQIDKAFPAPKRKMPLDII